MQCSMIYAEELTGDSKKSNKKPNKVKEYSKDKNKKRDYTKERERKRSFGD